MLLCLLFLLGFNEDSAKGSRLKQIQALIQGTTTRLKYAQSELEIIGQKHLGCFLPGNIDLHRKLMEIGPRHRISGITFKAPCNFYTFLVIEVYYVL